MLPDLSALPPEAQQQIQQIEQQTQQKLQQLAQAVTVEQIEQLLRDQKMRPFALDIETDSTIEPDQVAERKSRVELLGALGPLLQQAFGALGMAGSVAPQLGQFFAETLRYTTSGFKVARSMDEAIDELAKGMANFQPPPQDGGGEDPALAQMKVQVEQVKAQSAQAKGEADIQIAQLKLQGEQMKAQMGQLEAEKTAAETEKLRAEVKKILAEIGIAQQQVAIDGQKLAIDAQAQQQDHALQREGMEREGQQAERQFEADQRADQKKP